MHDDSVGPALRTIYKYETNVSQDLGVAPYKLNNGAVLTEARGGGGGGGSL